MWDENMTKNFYIMCCFAFIGCLGVTILFLAYIPHSFGSIMIGIISLIATISMTYFLFLSKVSWLRYDLVLYRRNRKNE